jgi:hypothetical protein
MTNNYCIAGNGKALSANVLGALCVESFLSENYLFRRNQLNGKVEFVTKTLDHGDGSHGPFADEEPIVDMSTYSVR